VPVGGAVCERVRTEDRNEKATDARMTVVDTVYERAILSTLGAWPCGSRACEALVRGI
jgi:hypothetical protein